MPERYIRPEMEDGVRGSHGSSMTFAEVLRIIIRRKYGIMLMIGLSFAAVLLGYKLQSPEYHAVSIMMISENQDKNELLSKLLGPDTGVSDGKSVRKDAELIRSMPIAELTIRALYANHNKYGSLELFDQRPFISPVARFFEPGRQLFAKQVSGQSALTEENLRRAAIRLNKRIRVEPVRETNVLKVSVASPFADEAALLTNTLCKVYREADISRNSEKYAQANRFVETMLHEQEQKVAEADMALSMYMSTHNIYEVTGNTQQLLEKLVEADARYNEVMVESNITRSGLDFLDKKLTEADKELSSRISKSVTDQLGSIMDELRKSENEYVHLVKENGSDATETKAKRQELEVLKARYEQLSRSKIAGQIGYAGRAQKYSYEVVSDKLKIERKLNELNFSASEFKRLKQYYEAQLDQLPKKEQEYVKLQRDREAVSKTYVFLKEKLDETRILIGSEVGSVSVVGAAFLPFEPESPDMKKTLLLGLLCSGLLATLYTYGVEKYDDRINDSSLFRNNRFGRVFMIPFAGKPYTDTDRRVNKHGEGGSLSRKFMDDVSVGNNSGSSSETDNKNPKITDDISSDFAESFRTLRAHLDCLPGERLSQLILVSGTSSNEGNSTICANLGISYAMVGRKTLIVDCNLQNASQHAIFACERQRGLGDYLSATEQNFDSGFIQETNVANLFVLTAGLEVMNPSELLGSAKMQLLLRELRGRFDVILLDSPQLFLSDSVQLAQQVDGILLVSRIGHTPKKLLMDLSGDEFFSPRILGVAVIESPDYRQFVFNRSKPAA